jgi:hypothetical protein
MKRVGAHAPGIGGARLLKISIENNELMFCGAPNFASAISLRLSDKC